MKLSMRHSENSIFPARGWVTRAGGLVRRVAGISALVTATLFAQAGGLQPQPPGPSVAGHWTGKMTMILAASKREVTLPIDLVLEQDGNNVTGKLIMRGNRTIPAKGIEENEKLNLLWDFNEAEH